jgi:hypothetical protein
MSLFVEQTGNRGSFRDFSLSSTNTERSHVFKLFGRRLLLHPLWLRYAELPAGKDEKVHYFIPVFGNGQGRRWDAPPPFSIGFRD